MLSLSLTVASQVSLETDPLSAVSLCICDRVHVVPTAPPSAEEGDDERPTGGIQMYEFETMELLKLLNIILMWRRSSVAVWEAR